MFQNINIIDTSENQFNRYQKSFKYDVLSHYTFLKIQISLYITFSYIRFLKKYNG